MSNAQQTLVTNRYVKSGVYIGKIYRPRPTQLTGLPRMPVFAGRGHRLKIARDIGLTRSYIFGEQLAIPEVAPHQGFLDFPSNGDKTVATLYQQDGTVISPNSWDFIDTGSGGIPVYGAILINLEVFDRNVTYFLDYQSTSRNVRDELSFHDLRQMTRVGDFPAQAKYTEFVDYYVPTELTSPMPDAGNLHNDPAILTPPDGIDAGSTANNLVGTIAGAAANTVVLPPTASAVNDFYVGWWITITTGAGAGQARNIESYDGITKTATIDSSGPSFAPIPVVPDNFGLVRGPAPINPTTYSSPMIVSVNNSTDYLGQYGRHYTLTMQNPTGISPNRSVELHWTATPVSGGNELEPTALDPIGGFPVPIHSSLTPPMIMVTEGGSAVPIEKGILLDVIWPVVGVNFTAGDQLEFVAEGPSIIEIDPRLIQTNQFAEVTAPIPAAGNTGTGSISLDLHTEFDDDFNTWWHIECINSGGVAPLRWADVAITKINTESGTSAGTYINEYSYHLNEADATTYLNKLVGSNTYLDFDFGLNNLLIGDTWSFSAAAARKYFTAKDDRTYTFQVTGAIPDVVSFYWSTDTFEGGFGTINVSAAGDTVPAADFPDGLRCYVRNIQTYNRFAVNDLFTFAGTPVTQASGTPLLDWSLEIRQEETISEDDVLHDALGTITSTTNTYYVILDRNPDQVLWVQDESGPSGAAAFISYTVIPNTPYIWFPTQPTGSVTVKYEHLGDEPGPSQGYYITAHYLRPEEDYDLPIRHLSEEDANDFLGPMSVNNDLMIMAQISFDNNVFACWTCQARDRDNDGYLTDYDYKQAVDATEIKSDITDLVVVNRYNVLAYSKASTIKMNDPFVRKERLQWQGFPVGMEIGDIDTPNTLYYNAKRSLQVYGDNPAHGAFIAVANNYATRTLLFDDGTTTEVTLDGSFIAGALASIVDSFDDPSATILRREVNGFNTMQEFDEKEQILLGTASMVYIQPLGSDGAGPHQIEEDLTVDTTAPDTTLISAMTQKQFVIRNLRDAVDKALVAVVPASRQAGVVLTQAFIVETLSGYTSTGIIAPYEDDSGNDRPIDPQEDVEVFRDNTDPTLYHFKFHFGIRYPIKRLFGLYSCDTKAFG